MEIDIRRSSRRHKTVQARLVDGVLRVAVPAAFSAEEEKHWVEEMVRRVERRLSTDAIDLEARARTLAKDLGLTPPESISWSHRQKTLWGSCTPAQRRIRISSRLASFPGWVIDYVIVHELAHLTRADHSEAFWALVDRYPMSQRARGFLHAKDAAPEEVAVRSGKRS